MPSQENEFPKFNLKNFAHGYKTFKDTIYSELFLIDKFGKLKEILPNEMYYHYEYFSKSRKGACFLDYLESILNNDSELISFINYILPTLNTQLNNRSWVLYNYEHKENLLNIIINVNNNNIFNLDFYYDEENYIIKRKIDAVTIKTINFNNETLTDSNQIRYQECIAEFLSYKKDILKENKLFYNDSLNKLKIVIDNTLKNNHKDKNREHPKLSNYRQISDLILSGRNSNIENFMEYVVKNIHHECEGQPKKFTEKEYVYLWLELNNILYLLNLYKK